MSRRLDWRRDGRDWPNRAASRFVAAGGLTWHMQEMGSGPKLLLLHGTAASTHSFRTLAPLLAERFTLLIPDLPGHAFSEAPRARMSLPLMRDLVAALLAETGFSPEVAAGHSAGAAVLVRMALDGRMAPRRIVGLNAALLPFPGHMGKLAPSLAQLLFLNPIAPRVFAFMAGEDSVKRLVGNMGSRLDREGLRLYRTLMGNPIHVAGALGMMANWDLDGLARDLPNLAVPLTLVTADRDRAVPPDTAVRVKALLPATEIVALKGVGHLAHEEKAEMVADVIVTAVGESQDPMARGS